MSRKSRRRWPYSRLAGKHKHVNLSYLKKTRTHVDIHTYIHILHHTLTPLISQRLMDRLGTLEKDSTAGMRKRSHQEVQQQNVKKARISTGAEMGPVGPAYAENPKGYLFNIFQVGGGIDGWVGSARQDVYRESFLYVVLVLRSFR